MTRPVDAYRQGKAARAANPDAPTWEGIMPFAVQPLVGAWLDGWSNHPHYNEANCCPECWSYGMTDLPDGIVRCRIIPCRERHWPPVDHERARLHIARRDAGAGI